MPNYDRDEGRSRRHRSRSRSLQREYESGRRRSASPLGRRDDTERHMSRTDRQQRYRSRSRSRERATTSSRRRSDDNYSKSTHRKRGRTRSREKRSSRSRSRSRDKQGRHSRSASTSSGRSTSSERRRRRRKEKKRGKKEKKDRKREKKKLKGALGANWGKYGVITETDMYNKDPEFRTWLIEEKMVNHEVLSRDMTKKYFKEFVEDYNTATLPHEKFYDMESYERKMNLIKSGALALEDIKDYDPLQDLQSHSRSMKRTAAEQDSFLSKSQVEELRDIQRQRQQIGKMKLLGMNIDSRLGVRMEEGME